MSDPFYGEIRAVGFDYAPYGWFPCDGRLVNKNEYPQLFALLGTMYGGDGVTTFGIPDLRCRGIAGVGRQELTGLPTVNPGQKLGHASVNLEISQLPPHNHVAQVYDYGHTHPINVLPHTHPFAVPAAADTTAATLTSPVGNVLGNTQAMENAITNSPIGLDPGPLPLYAPAAAAAATMAPGTTGDPTSGNGTSGKSTTGIAVMTHMTGLGVPLPTQSPAMGLYYIICWKGAWPERS